jgi:hypothetical protein
VLPSDRTKLRPLAAGDVTPFQALCFLGVQLSAGLAILTQLNLYRLVAFGRLGTGRVLTYFCRGLQHCVGSDFSESGGSVSLHEAGHLLPAIRTR